MNRRRVLLLVAVLIAVLGTALVFVYARGADTRAQEQFDTVEVLLATAVIEPGEKIEDAAASGKLASLPVAQQDVLPRAQTSIESLSGLVATTRIFPGEQIITDKFGGEAESTSPLQIPRGQVAISVNLSDTARVAGFVNPGSEVAIFLNGSDAAGPFTRVLLPRVTVLGVGSTTPTTTTKTAADGAQTTEQLPRTLLTLAVDQAQAEKILFATGNGELAFALLTGNSAIKPGAGVTSNNLFE